MLLTPGAFADSFVICHCSRRLRQILQPLQSIIIHHSSDPSLLSEKNTNYFHH